MTFSTKSIWHVLRQEVFKAIGRVTAQNYLLPDSCLIIAPHPDDEILGCGGMLAALAAGNTEAAIVFITAGEASHTDCCKTQARDIAIQRQRLAIVANGLLGMQPDRLHFLDGRDGKLPRQGHDGFSPLVEKIAVCIKKSAPAAVFCPHPSEGWSDHIAAGELTRAALKMIAPAPKPRLYYYCVWFWHNMPLAQAWHIDWRKAHLLDISDQLSLKRQAMQVYLNALAPCGNPWIGKMPPEFLRAFGWNKELFFTADI